MATTLRQAEGASSEFEITMRDPRHPDRERTFVAIYTWESIERIEGLAGRHYQRMTSIFDLIEKPGITNLAILLVEAINHDATDTSWGGNDKKPDLKKMVRLLGVDFGGQKFLELWLAVCKCVRLNIRPDDAAIPAPNTRGGAQASTTTTTTTPETPPTPGVGSGDASSTPSPQALTKPGSGG